MTRMLGVLLSPKLKVQNKIRQLEEEFAIPMENKEMGEELNQMCNLSDYVEESGFYGYRLKRSWRKACRFQRLRRL